ncbi:MAG: PKD domain-containing protein, partial [Bacteroidales bacterium]|nr:PKD domain-containing protein [Bacteroidales bacterium]
MKHHSYFTFSVYKRRMPMVFLWSILLLSVSWKGSGQLTADFIASTTSICSGSSVQFTDNSTETTGSTTYDWNFGAGASPATATGAGPHTVTYSVPGTSTVSLTITDGVSDSETKPDFITVAAFPSSPTANLTQPTCLVSTGSITVTSPTGANIQYSIDGTNWVSSATFSNLAPNANYTIRVRDNSVNPSCISASDFTINAQPPTPT